MNDSGWTQKLIPHQVAAHMTNAGIDTIKQLSDRSGVGYTVVKGVMSGTRDAHDRVIGCFARALNVHPAQISGWIFNDTHR